MIDYQYLYPNYGCDPWYDILTQDKFIRYFNDPDSRYCIHTDGSLWVEPLFRDFMDIATGISMAARAEETIDPHSGELLQQMAYRHYISAKKKKSSNLPIPDTIDPAALSPEQLAAQILSHFCASAADASYRYARSGDLGSSLSLLKSKAVA